MKKIRDISEIFKLRLVRKADIPILYEMLKLNVKTPNASVSGNSLPPFKKSEKFVTKYLEDNENHEYYKWYVILFGKEIVGNIFISKNNQIGYLVLKEFQGRGFAQKALRLVMEKNPRKRYFLTINMKNQASLKIAEKFHFKEKAIIFEKLNSDYSKDKIKLR